MSRIRFRFQDFEKILFFGLIAAHLFPIWYFKYFPSEDGPAHLQTARIFLDYWNPATPIFSKYYELTPYLVPYWTVYIILAGLMKVFPVLVSEKIFLSAYTIAFPLLVRSVLGKIQPDSKYLALLVFPFLHSYLYHLGLYSFLIGLLVYCAFVYTLLGRSDHHYKYRALILLLVIAYLSHIFSFSMCAFTWFFYQATQRKSLLKLFAFIFAGGVLIYFFYNTDFIKPRIPNFILSLRCILDGRLLVSYGAIEKYGARVLYTVFGAVCVWILGIRKFKLNLKEDIWLWTAAATFFSYVLILFFIREAHIAERVTIYLFLMIIFWLGAQSIRYRKILAALCILASVVALFLLGQHLKKYIEFNDYLDEYYSVSSYIQPSSTLLPIYIGESKDPMNQMISSSRTKVFIAASGVLAAERGFVAFSNFLAAFNEGPFRDRNELRPLKYLGNIFKRNPKLWILGYPTQTPGTVDYVLLYGTFRRWKDTDNVGLRDIQGKLWGKYDLIYTSEKRGFVRLFRRKDLNTVTSLPDNPAQY